MDKGKYIAELHRLPCVVCFLQLGIRVQATEVHHPEAVRDGMSDWAGISLCHEHHQGANGIHRLSRRGFYLRYNLTDIDLLACTNKLMHEEK